MIGTKSRTTKYLVDMAVWRALEEGEDWLDSHDLAESLGTEVTYVQHLLREAEHVCRYADDLGRYRVHHAPVCSPSCQDHATRAGEAPHEPACQTCWLIPAATGACGCY